MSIIWEILKFLACGWLVLLLLLSALHRVGCWFHDWRLIRKRERAG